MKVRPRIQRAFWRGLPRRARALSVRCWFRIPRTACSDSYCTSREVPHGSWRRRRDPGLLEPSGFMKVISWPRGYLFFSAIQRFALKRA